MGVGTAIDLVRTAWHRAFAHLLLPRPASFANRPACCCHPAGFDKKQLPGGFEPPALTLLVSRSNQLSYESAWHGLSAMPIFYFLSIVLIPC